MLNGDVLTDIDLTAQLAQHERTGARATLALIAGRGSLGLRPGPPRPPTARCREFLEKPRARADRHQPDQRRRLHPRAQRARRRWVRPAPTSRSSARCSRRSSATGCSATRPTATGWTSALPSATSRGPTTSSRATCAPRSATRWRAAGLALAAGRASTGASCRRCWSAPGSEIAAGAIVGGRAVLGARRAGRRGRRTSRARCCSTASRSARARTVSGVDHRARTWQVGEHCHIEGGVVLGEGVRIGADNILAGRRAYLPRRGAARQERSSFEHRHRADRRGDRRDRPDAPARGHPRDARSAARRAVARASRRTSSPRTRPAG